MKSVALFLSVLLFPLLTSGCGRKLNTRSNASADGGTARVVNRPEDAAFKSASEDFDVVTRPGEFGVYNLITPKAGVNQARSTASNSAHMNHEGNELVVSTISGQSVVSLSGTPVLSSELLRGGEGTLRLEVPLLNFARENSRLFRSFHESLERRLQKPVFYALEVVCPTQIKVGASELGFQTNQRVCRLNQPIVGRLETAIEASAISLETAVEVPVSVGVRPILGLIQLSLNRDRARDEILRAFPESARKSVPFSESLSIARLVLTKIETDPVARLADTGVPNFRASELDIISDFFEATSTGLFRLRSTPKNGELLETKTFEQNPNLDVIAFKGTGASSLLSAVSFQADRPNLTPVSENTATTKVRLPVTLLNEDDGYIVVSAVRSAKSTISLGPVDHIDNQVCLRSADGCDRGQYECVDPGRLVPSPTGETMCNAWTCRYIGPPRPYFMPLTKACSAVPERDRHLYSTIPPCLGTELRQVPFCSVVPSPAAVNSWTQNTSIPQADNYRFRCDAPRVVCQASENQWLERSTFANPYLNDTFQSVQVNEAQTRSILASIRTGAEADGHALELSLSRDQKSIRIKANQLIHEPELEIASQVSENAVCGSRVLRWDRKVIYSCNLPNQSPESITMTDNEERDMIARGETPGIRKTFYPSHIIQFQLLLPNRNEVPL